MRNDGGPAFPVTADVLCDHTSGTSVRLKGMSLRDAFAIAAVQGIVSTVDFNNLEDGEFCAPTCAATAYRLADAMLVERAK